MNENNTPEAPSGRPAGAECSETACTFRMERAELNVREAFEDLARDFRLDFHVDPMSSRSMIYTAFVDRETQEDLVTVSIGQDGTYYLAERVLGTPMSRLIKRTKDVLELLTADLPELLSRKTMEQERRRQGAPQTALR